MFKGLSKRIRPSPTHVITATSVGRRGDGNVQIIANLESARCQSLIVVLEFLSRNGPSDFTGVIARSTKLRENQSEVKEGALATRVWVDFFHEGGQFLQSSIHPE